MQYTSSLHYDRRLFRHDIRGSIAHVRGLNAGGILTDDELSAVEQALAQVESEMSSGNFDFMDSDEDIHTAIERRVTEIAGPAGAKVHTGRSRNDQVTTALRLFLKDELVETIGRILDLQTVLLEVAKRHPDAYLPGYTHVQRAQPVMFAHHMAAHAWALARDVDRLRSTLHRLDVSPLGAGALAGSSLPLDPQATADALGFAARFANSLDAVSDRDYVADTLYCFAMLGVHLSRIGEEVVLWTSQEFGFMILDDAYATGSSMLPQKKNADIAELARGKSGRLIGNLTGFLATLKGLPLSYNRDLQEDKEPLFDSLDQTNLALIAIAGMLDTAKYQADAMKVAADDPMAASIDLAEWLVRNGTPFREAHAIVGELVRRSLSDGTSLADLVSADSRLGDEPAELLAPGRAVRQRSTLGAAGPERVEEQLSQLAAWINEARTSPFSAS